jgi:REP element-mobilizing transposase RayT
MPGGVGIMERPRLPHISEDGATYFVTWCLRRGQPHLSEVERQLVADALRAFDGERYNLFAYVVMDDHVHVVVRPLQELGLSELLHTWKSYTANKLQRSAGRRGSVWQSRRHDRIIRSETDLWEKVDYVLTNPVRRWGVEDYPYAGRGTWPVGW